MHTLNRHQKQMLRYCLDYNNPMLFVDMRLRKSLVTIRWIELLINKGNVLIITPYSALFSWETELLTEHQFNIFKLIGSKRNRLDVLNHNYTYYEQSKEISWFLINPEFIRYDKRLSETEKKVRKRSKSLWISDLALDIGQRYWDIIVFDECTYLQNPKNTITQYFNKLPIHANHRIGLTGTPATEGLHQYYSMCNTIEPGTFIEKNYWEFEYKRFNILPNHQLWCSKKNQEYIHKQLSQYVFFLSRDELNLGGKIIREIRTVKLPNKIQKIYSRAENEFLLEIEEHDIEKKTIYSMVKYQWLRRLCGGVIDGKIIDKSKMNIVLSLIRTDFKNDQVIIWCNFIDEILQLQDIFKNNGFKSTTIYGKINPVLRERRRQKFQKKRVSIVICQPSCFKYGIDLSISTTMIYYSLPNSSLTYWQSESRPVNLDKQDSILVVYLLMENTVDFSVYEGLMKKESRRKLTKRIVQDIQMRNK